MVQMECNYVTPSFFRELEREYQSGLKSEDGALEGAAEPEDRMAQLARGAAAAQSAACCRLSVAASVLSLAPG